MVTVNLVAMQRPYIPAYKLNVRLYRLLLQLNLSENVSFSDDFRINRSLYVPVFIPYAPIH